jgi:hypothetical protein
MIKDDVVSVFRSLVKILVGDGKPVLFWKERWLGREVVENIVPQVLNFVSIIHKNSKDGG